MRRAGCLLLVCTLSLAALPGHAAPRAPRAAPATSERSAYEQALQALREGRLSEATAALRRQLATQPGPPEARRLLARLLLDAGRLDEAEPLLEAATDLASLTVLARLQAARGQSALALASLKRAEAEGAGQGSYLAFAALLAQEAGLHDEAIVYFRRALHTPNAQAQWWLAAAVSQNALGDSAGASSSLQTALQHPQLSSTARQEARRLQREIQRRAEIRARGGE